MLTLQNLFDNAWRHAVIEKQPPAIDADLSCRYRGPNGTRCLIGVSIPDEKYRPECEGLLAAGVLLFLGISNAAYPEIETVTRDAAEMRERNDITLGDHWGEVRTMRRLQACHDHAARDLTNYTRDVEIKLRQFAVDNNLTIPPAPLGVA